MSSFINALLFIAIGFIYIMWIGLIIVLIGCAFLYANKVTQKVHKKTKEKDQIKAAINDSKRSIIGPFNSPKDLIDYVKKNNTDPKQIAIVNVNGVAKAFHIYNTIDNVITIEEAIVDWDEITYQLSIENAQHSKELKG